MSASLVIQTSFLGDTILTTPLLAALANRGPVDVVTTPASSALLANHPALRTIIPYDKRGTESGIGGLLRLASRLRAAKYETVYLAQGSWRSSGLAYLAGIPNRVGFSTSTGRSLYTKKVLYRDDLHHAARLLMLSRPNGREATEDELRPSLYPGKAERDAVDALLAAAGVTVLETLIAVAPGSVWGTKRWPYYAELAAQLGEGKRVVIIGGTEDAAVADEIVRAVPSAVNAVDRLSLLASAELIGRCAAIVTNDSSPLHLASAMDVPTVAIFGPTIPAFGFGPLASKRTVLGIDALACRPCDRHGPMKCPLGHHKCMRDIAAVSVMTSLQTLFG